MLLDEITENLKTAQRDRDEIKVSTLRLLLSEIRNAEIAQRKVLEDEVIIKVIQFEIKKRKQAVEAFKSAGRIDRAQRESDEEQILTEYLPKQLSDTELNNVIASTINQLGARGLSDMGKVMGMVKAKVGNTADPGRVSQKLKQRLING